MATYKNEILDLLKKQYIEVTGKASFQSQQGMKAYYTQELIDNLYLPMSSGAFASYGQGSGNEISSGKMNALRSSSALTYNLFWDQIGELTGESENNRIGKGIYQVEFEKQYYTLDKSASNKPANLDVFLYCKHTEEAVLSVSKRP